MSAASQDMNPDRRLSSTRRFRQTLNISRVYAIAICVVVNLCAALAWQVQAQGYPTRPIRMIVPFAAGSATDTVARVYGQKMSESLGQPVVVENRTGAVGTIAADLVAKAAPDGYTLLLGTISTHAINTSLYKNMPYDAIKDFAPISRIANVPNLLVVNKNAPYSTLPELVAWGKANPGKLTFGSSGSGTTLHLSGELFKQMTGVEMTHIPYKGSAPAVSDLIGGQISMLFDNMPTVLPQVKSGNLKGLATTAATRNRELPDIPTVSESGLTGFLVMSWFGLLAPAGTPADIIQKLNQAVVEIIKTPDVQTRILAIGSEPSPESTAEFAAFIQAETTKWAEVVKKSGASVE
ncbi:MAG: tripartite tricarboxylate transporter substrate binding protein [Alcaligenaceae bacterium]